jgi:hypothetical protein
MVSIILVFLQGKEKKLFDGDMLEDFYKYAHLDEVRRKFLRVVEQNREYFGLIV